MAHAESITFEEFRTRFSTEESCRPEHVPVPRLPASDVRHGWDGHAPHTSAVDGLVLGDLSVCHGQTRHFRCSAEPHAEHLL